MKRPIRNLLIFGIVFLLLAGACAAPAPPTPTPAPPTPTPGPLDLVKAFQETFNKRDTEGFLALFVDNPVWGPGSPARSKKAVRNLAEYWFEINGQFELSDCKTENGSVSCNGLFRCDANYSPGVDFFHVVDLKFVFTEGKISEVDGAMGTSDEAAVYSTYESQMLSWASQNLPEDAAKYNTAAEWDKFSGTGDQGSGKLTATELGQVAERLYTGYAKAKK